MINFKQKELIETLEQEIKSQFPAFKILSVSDNADNGLWITIKELNDEESELEMEEIIAEKVTNILVTHGYHFQVIPTKVER